MLPTPATQESPLNVKAKLKLIHHLPQLAQQNGKPLFYIFKFAHKTTNISRLCIHQSHLSKFALNVYGKMPSSLANHIRVILHSILSAVNHMVPCKINP